MDEFYNLLVRKKLSNIRNIVNFFFDSDFEEVYETIIEAYVYSNTSELYDSRTSLFNFSASFTLSGGDYPCENLECRLKRVDELATFTSLYANTVILFNPLDFIYYHMQGDDDISEAEENHIRQEGSFAFAVLLKLRPLIVNKYIVISRTIVTLCKSCKTNRDKHMGTLAKSLYKIAESTIVPEIKEKTTLEYDTQHSFHLNGIDKFLGEDIFFNYKKFPKYLLSENNKRLNNIKDIPNGSPLFKSIIGESIDSLMAQKFGLYENYTTTFLTTNYIEKKILETFDENYSSKPYEFLTKDIPIILDTPYEYIIETREKYKDEFNNFQETISTIFEKGKTFKNQQDFNSYAEGEIHDQVEDIKKIQKERSKELVRKGITEALIASASIFVSIQTNSALPITLEIAKTFHEAHKMKVEDKKIEQEIRSKPLYFYYNLLNN